MPIQLGIAGNNGAAGWTTITPKRDSGGFLTSWAQQQGSNYDVNYYNNNGVKTFNANVVGDGTRFIFVHPTSGDDNNPGTLASPRLNLDAFTFIPGGAKSTFSSTFNGAARLLRDTYPDWLCLMNGGVYDHNNGVYWNDTGVKPRGPVITLDANGYSAETPQVIGNFDWAVIAANPDLPPEPNPGTGGAHPKIILKDNVTYASAPYGSSDAGFAVGGDNWAIIGIEVTTETTGGFQAIVISTNSFRNFALIEDCQVDHAGFGIQWGDPRALENYLITRRCRVLYNTGQGIMGGIAQHNRYEENFFRGNGGGVQSHNFYRGSCGWDNGKDTRSYPGVEIGNILTDLGDNDGARSGIIATNNLWIRNANAMEDFGLQVPGQRGLIDKCVFVEGIHSGVNACEGVQFGGSGSGPSGSSYFQGEFMNKAGATVSNTLFIHNASNDANPYLTGVTFNSGADDIIIENNVLFDSPKWVMEESCPNAIKSDGFTWTGGSGYTNSVAVAATKPVDAYGSGQGVNAWFTGTRLEVSESDRWLLGFWGHMWVETSGRPNGDVSDWYFTHTQLGAKAYGSIAFSQQPADNSTLTFNGVTVTMHDGSGGTVDRGADLATCVDNLKTFLNASGNAEIAKCTYNSIGTPTHNTLTITSKTNGTTMNSYTLAASVSPNSFGSVSGSTLSGGVPDYVHFCQLPWTGGSNWTATVYIPTHISTTMDASCPNPGGFNGSLFTLNAIVKGNAVTKLLLKDKLNGDGAPEYNSHNGRNYRVGDILTQSGTPLGNGTGFTITVTNLCANTVAASNKRYADTLMTDANPYPGTEWGNPNVWMDRGRNATRYAQEVMGLSNLDTMLDMIATTQKKGTWDSKLTAVAINDWIRTGFGLTGSPPPPPPSLDILLGQAML